MTETLALARPNFPQFALAVTGEPVGDLDLVRRSRAGDGQAFETLFRRYERRIYGLCLRMLGDPERAEELTQESFVRAWRKLSSFRGDSSLLTWLHRLTVNVVLGHLRSRRRREERLAEFETVERPPRQTRSNPGAGLDLERAIAALPPRARTVFVLHDVEGYSHVEIAGMIGMAEGTSKVHLHRARKTLRKALAR